MKRILNDIQVLGAYKLYIDQKLSIYELSKLFNCTSYTIQREFRKANLIIRDASHARQKYPINENIFDTIDTEEKAYWLGFLYADGNVTSTCYRVRLSLAEQDKEILIKFSNFIYNCERIKFYKKPIDKLGQDLVYVDVCNQHIAKKLTELGCPPKKTFILKFPKWLNINLQNHFIRGYFDGDGCLSNYKYLRKGKGKLTKGLIISEEDKSCFSLLSTNEFIQGVSDIFKSIEITSCISKRHKKRLNNNFTLKVSGNVQIERLMDWIYKDANIFLQRKYKKYLELKQLNYNRHSK